MSSTLSFIKSSLLIGIFVSLEVRGYVTSSPRVLPCANEVNDDIACANGNNHQPKPMNLVKRVPVEPGFYTAERLEGIVKEHLALQDVNNPQDSQLIVDDQGGWKLIKLPKIKPFDVPEEYWEMKDKHTKETLRRQRYPKKLESLAEKLKTLELNEFMVMGPGTLTGTEISEVTRLPSPYLTSGSNWFKSFRELAMIQLLAHACSNNGPRVHIGIQEPAYSPKDEEFVRNLPKLEPKDKFDVTIYPAKLKLAILPFIKMAGSSDRFVLVTINHLYQMPLYEIVPNMEPNRRPKVIITQRNIWQSGKKEPSLALDVPERVVAKTEKWVAMLKNEYKEIEVDDEGEPKWNIDGMRCYVRMEDA